MNNRKFIKILPILLAGVFVGVLLTLFIPKINISNLFHSKQAVSETTTAETINEEPEYAFGLRVDTFAMHKAEILPNEFVSEILTRFKIDNQTVHELAKKSSDIFDFRQFRAGNSYTILAEEKETDTIAKYMVYEKNPIEYVVYNLQNPEDIQIGKRPVKKVERSIEATIDGSLWNTLLDNNAPTELAVKLSKVYQWTIDFHRLDAGDEFRAVYDEVFVDGQYYKTDSIKACYFKHKGDDYYAFYFDQGGEKQAGFYDETGESLKRAFLRAPVEYSRISSRYSGRRFHPVQKRYKAHLGTDYAAPHGTPIYSTADGTISVASYTRGNGRYVKVRHNDTYTTQYLHMSRIKDGIRPGVRVKQGDVIGYVGSTGLATGPHVCYRFWKNGKQVDHLALDLPHGDPISDDKMAEFEEIKAAYLQRLNSPDQVIQAPKSEAFTVASANTETNQ